MRRGKRLRAQKHKSTRPSKHEHMLVEMQTSTRAQRYLSTRGPECKSTNTRVHDHRSPDPEHQATVTKAKSQEHGGTKLPNRGLGQKGATHTQHTAMQPQKHKGTKRK